MLSLGLCSLLDSITFMLGFNQAFTVVVMCLYTHFDLKSNCFNSPLFLNLFLTSFLFVVMTLFFCLLSSDCYEEMKLNKE